MKTNTLALILVASIAACGGGDTKPPVAPEPTPAVAEPTPTPEETTPPVASEPAPPAVPEPPPFELAIGDATVFEGTGKAEKAVFKLHADGTTESSGTKTKKKKTTTVWNPGPTVKADGSIEAKGAAVAKISADSITDLATGQALPLKLDGNTVSATGPEGEVKLVLGDDSKIAVVGGPMDGKSWRVEAADPKVAHTVLVLVGLNMLSGSTSSGTATSSPAPKK
jgi:hypothetical protein